MSSLSSASDEAASLSVTVRAVDMATCENMEIWKTWAVVEDGADVSVDLSRSCSRLDYVLERHKTITADVKSASSGMGCLIHPEVGRKLI